MKWFRFYSEALDDPKVQALPPVLYKHWVNLLCLASESQGQLPGVSDVAFRLRVAPSKAQGILDDLRGRGLVDDLTPHNWNGRQFASDARDTPGRKLADKARRHDGEKWVNPPPTRRRTGVTEADTEQIQNRTDTETEAEAEQTPPPLAFRLYEQAVGMLDLHISQKITEALDEGWSEECQIHCFHEASEHNARNWKYIDAIRVRHKAEGCFGGRKNGKADPEWTTEEMQTWADQQVAANQAD